MPKTTKGVKGNGNKVKGNKNKKYKTFEAKCDNGDYYAVVIEKVGGNYLRVQPENSEKNILVRIPGRMFKRRWANIGDMLVCIGEGEDKDEIKGFVSYYEIDSVKQRFKTHYDTNQDKEDMFEFIAESDKSDINEPDEEEIEEDKVKQESGLIGDIDFDII
jgi:translation initiation factor IF-1